MLAVINNLIQIVRTYRPSCWHIGWRGKKLELVEKILKKTQKEMLYRNKVDTIFIGKSLQ